LDENGKGRLRLGPIPRHGYCPERVGLEKMQNDKSLPSPMTSETLYVFEPELEREACEETPGRENTLMQQSASAG